MLTGVRAEKGWWTCEEDLWLSNVDLPRGEFEDWHTISEEAGEDARKKRIRNNKARVAFRFTSTMKIKGNRYRILMNFLKLHVGKDLQLDFIILDKEFDTIAWAQLRIEVEHERLVLEDLFVKPEARRGGIGSELIRRIEEFSCLEPGVHKVSNEIIVPIPAGRYYDSTKAGSRENILCKEWVRVDK